MTQAGRVLSLHRWPVKSMAGEQMEALELDGRGAAGDRTHAVFDVFKGARRRLTARQAPRLLAWHAGYPLGAVVDPAHPPLPLLTGPDGCRGTWGDAELAEALGDDLGRPVLLHRDLAGQQDLPNSVLVTTEVSLRALEATLGQPVDLRRFRTNLHLTLDVPAYAEEHWTGRRLRVGDAELELLHPCRRCVIPTRDPETQQRWPELLRRLVGERDGIFGINARPVGPARVRAGDPAAAR